MSETMLKIRCAIVDDHPLVRQGIQMTLSDAPEFEIVAEGANGNDALAIARELRPDVMLLDFSMPYGGVDTIVAIRAEHPAVKIALFSIRNEIATVKAVLEAGALGFISKGIDGSELLASVRRIASGERYVSEDLAAKLAITETPGPAGGAGAPP